MTAFLAAVILMLPMTQQGQEYREKVVQPYDAKLERMAHCESTKRWHIVNRVWDARNNRYVTYYGGLQFDLKTWRSVNGWGYPHKASELEQKFRAVLLIKRRGYSPWPVCGYV